MESTSTYERGWLKPSSRGARPPPLILLGACHIGYPSKPGTSEMRQPKSSP